MIQTVVWLATLVLIVLVAAVFLWVALNSTKKGEFQPIVKKWYKARTIYAVILIAVMIVVSIYTLRELPYNKPSHVSGEEVIPVSVEAFQFGFEMDETEFKVGDTIEFNVTTRDVTHGFGVYNPKMEIIGQSQAMPDYTNTIYITFDEAGTYKVLCLEYCGLAHHLMSMEFTVTE